MSECHMPRVPLRPACLSATLLLCLAAGLPVAAQVQVTPPPARTGVQVTPPERSQVQVKPPPQRPGTRAVVPTRQDGAVVAPTRESRVAPPPRGHLELHRAQIQGLRDSGPAAIDKPLPGGWALAGFELRFLNGDHKL